MEARRNEYSQRMLEDAARYQTLQEQQQKEARDFRQVQAQIYERHTEQMNKKMKDHEDAMTKENESINYLRENIATMKKNNRTTMEQILADADTEIQEMQLKN